MDAEELIRCVRLQAGAEHLRDRVLRAARWARFEGRLWRWTWGAAAVILGAAIPVNLSLEHPHPPSESPFVARQVEEAMGSIKDESMRPRIKLALTPRQTGPVLREIP